MKFHTQILGQSQLKLLTKLGPFMTNKGCYLGGGTAIALMLGHRTSIDLDWFSGKPIGDARVWVDRMRNAGFALRDVDISKGTLYATCSGVRFSLIEYRYPSLHRPVPWKAMNCRLASLDDLACMKLSAIVSRGSKKDFVDIFALMRMHKSLPQMLRLFQKRFPKAEVFSVLRALSYFDDAEKERMPRMFWKSTWPEVKRSILTEAEKVLP